MKYELLPMIQPLKLYHRESGNSMDAGNTSPAIHYDYNCMIHYDTSIIRDEIKSSGKFAICHSFKIARTPSLPNLSETPDFPTFTVVNMVELYIQNNITIKSHSITIEKTSYYQSIINPTVICAIARSRHL